MVIYEVDLSMVIKSISEIGNLFLYLHSHYMIQLKIIFAPS